MENGSTFEQKLKLYAQNEWITKKIGSTLSIFYLSYKESLVSNGIDPTPYMGLFDTYLDLIKKEILTPYSFEPYHMAIRKPVDYYKFGNDFFKPLIDFKKSDVTGHETIKEIVKKRSLGENVILFSNHQVEADPQAISLLLDPHYSHLAERMIFIAGERVITDPVAIPFSMGRNLLCIYSKRYIDHPPQEKEQKQLHNKRTMTLMSELLTKGGQIIYVAPSGGRDRIGPSGKPEVAKFDPQSLEMFYLMAQKSGTPTSFYPMALSTYDLLPPPETIQVELGESRQPGHGSIHLSIGPALTMESFPGDHNPDKKLRRQARCDHIWSLVCSLYKNLS